MTDFSDDEKTDPSIVLPASMVKANIAPPTYSAPSAPPPPPVTSATAPVRMPEMGPLDALMKDPEITEIMVNDLRNVMVEKNGQMQFSGFSYTAIDDLNRLTRSILDLTGRILSPDHPYVDTMLPDGSRVNIVGPPLTQLGPCLTIRKFPSRRPSLEDLVKNGMLDQRMGYFLQACALGRMNLLISGGTSSGKTTLLNSLVSLIPKSERIVTIEDTPELAVAHANSVKLQTKPQTPGSAAVTARELVANSLRMRPDRVILGECRRGEAFDMLQAMNTGHEGSMTTLHANASRDALARMETLCMLAGVDLPLIAIRRQIADAVDIVVQVKRFRDHKRRVVSISEISGMEGETITTQDLFLATPDGSGFRGTGLAPSLLDRLRDNGVELPRNFFA